MSTRSHTSQPHFGEGEDGFTLVEVIAAFVVVTIAFVVMASTVGSLTRQSNDLQRKDRAIALAQTVLDRQKAFECGLAIPEPPQGFATLEDLNARCVQPPQDAVTSPPADIGVMVGDVTFTDYRDTALTDAGDNAGARSGRRYMVTIRTSFQAGDGGSCKAQADALAEGAPLAVLRTVEVHDPKQPGTPPLYRAVARDPVPGKFQSIAANRAALLVDTAADATISWQDGATTTWKATRAGLGGCAVFPFLPKGSDFIALGDSPGGPFSPVDLNQSVVCKPVGPAC